MSYPREPTRTLGVSRRELYGRTRLLTGAENRWLEARNDGDVDGALVAIRAKLGARKTARSRRALSGAIVAAALLCALVIFFRPSAQPIGFTISGRAAQSGATAGTAGRNDVVLFNDGSQVMLQPDAEARIVSTEARGAHVVVDRGKFRADIVPRDGGRWLFSAGPFAIHVKGTSFEAEWDPTVGRLAVSMREGRVVVQGACANDASLAGQESRVFQCSNAGATQSSVASRPEPLGSAQAASASGALPVSGPLPMPSLPTAALAEPRPSGAPLPAPAASTPNESPVGWRQSAARGKYTEAWARAREEGALSQNLGAEDLLLLADVARLGGAPGQASALYLRVRSSFPNTAAARTAAFHLGRMASRGAPAEARRWLELYLAEEPGGRFAQEALGRLIEVDVALGEPATAMARAKAYLRAYPTGPHAAFARSVIAE